MQYRNIGISQYYDETTPKVTHSNFLQYNRCFEVYLLIFKCLWWFLVANESTFNTRSVYLMQRFCPERYLINVWETLQTLITPYDIP